MMRHWKYLLLLLAPSSLFAASNFQPALQFSYVLISSEPASLKGFQLFSQWQQKELFWRRFQFIFDVGLSHVEHPCEHYNNLTILSASPLLRYHFKPRYDYQFYVDLSVGIAYLNHTQVENRNLGFHFSFQDRIGVGMLFGDRKQYSVGAHIVHYSNASLGRHNSGVTIPVVVDFSVKL